MLRRMILSGSTDEVQSLLKHVLDISNGGTGQNGSGNVRGGKLRQKEIARGLLMKREYKLLTDLNASSLERAELLRRVQSDLQSHAQVESHFVPLLLSLIRRELGWLKQSFIPVSVEDVHSVRSRISTLYLKVMQQSQINPAIAVYKRTGAVQVEPQEQELTRIRQHVLRHLIADLKRNGFISSGYIKDSTNGTTRNESISVEIIESLTI